MNTRNFQKYLNTTFNSLKAPNSICRYDFYLIIQHELIKNLLLAYFFQNEKFSRNDIHTSITTDIFFILASVESILKFFN